MACESRIPGPGRWILLRVKRDGRRKHYAARLAQNGRYWVTYGSIQYCIRLDETVRRSWWTELPEWWEGFNE